MSQSHFTLSFPLQSPADAKARARDMTPLRGLLVLDQRPMSLALRSNGPRQVPGVDLCHKVGVSHAIHPVR